MNRRDTIKTLMAASGSLIALPAWADGWHPSTIVNNPTSFSAATQETLAAVANTIIPAGNAIGAISVGVDKFLQKLIDDCYEKEVRDNVNTQLEALESAAKNLFGKSFKDCEQSHREGMFLKFSTSENTSELDFFKLIKSETIRGFNTSREVMVNYLHFKQVPGHYYGCADVKA